MCPAHRRPRPAAIMETGRLARPLMHVRYAHVAKIATCAPFLSHHTCGPAQLHRLCLPSCRLPPCPLELGGQRCRLARVHASPTSWLTLRHGGFCPPYAPSSPTPQVELKMHSRDALFAMTTLAGVVRESWTQNKGRCCSGPVGWRGSEQVIPMRSL